MEETGIRDPRMALKHLKKEMKNKHRGAVAQSRRAMMQRDQTLKQARMAGDEDPAVSGEAAVDAGQDVASRPFMPGAPAKESFSKRLKTGLKALGGGARDLSADEDEEAKRKKEEDRKKEEAARTQYLG